MVQIRHPIEASPRRASARAVPRLPQRAGLWAVAFAFLAVSALTAPSSLYGLYEQQEHLSSLTITIVYAVYAIGIVVSLLLAGHVSDWYGRRMAMLPALAIAVAAAVVFLAWRSLAWPARRPYAHRPGPGRCPGHRHGVHHRPGRRPRRCRHPPGRDRGHHREHRRPGLRSADRRPARPLRAARTHAPVHRLPRRADRRGGRGDPGAGGPPGRSSAGRGTTRSGSPRRRTDGSSSSRPRPGRSPRSRSAGCSPGWPERSWPVPCTSPRPRLPDWRSS